MLLTRGRSLHVVGLTPPGRFPTVVPDPGPWWSTLSALGRHRLSWASCNFRFWELLCDPERSDRPLVESARRARIGMDILRSPRTYDSPPLYFEAVAALVAHAELVSLAEGGFQLELARGPSVPGLDYRDGAALLRAACGDSLLGDAVEATLGEVPADADLVLFSVTSDEDLLTAMMAATRLRRLSPRTHLCLADHGHEGFSTGALAQVFDTIVVSLDERDAVVHRLAHALATGGAPRGFLRREDLDAAPMPARATLTAPPAQPLFAPESILATRVKDVPAALDRLEALVDAGYLTMIFCDEALAPALLRELCHGIVARGLDFRWGCRCQLELAHTPELFALMRRAGCFEVRYRLGSIVPATRRRMGKHVDGLDAARVRTVLGWIDDAGIAAHVSLLAGFPGESAVELEETVAFTIDALAGLRGATFQLDRFAGPPMPEAATRGALEMLPALQARLLAALGWQDVIDTHGHDDGVRLYFSSGHGAIWKCRPDNALANPLLRPILAVEEAWPSF